MKCASRSTSLGQITVWAEQLAITQLDVGCGANCQTGDALTDQALGQVGEYLAGERRLFDLSLAPKGTIFQQQVWQALLQIPYGQTRTYSEIAAQIGRPRAVRAVGTAIGKNPIPIIVPCHRVVAKNGLGGFSLGLPIKKRLLQIEQALR